MLDTGTLLTLTPTLTPTLTLTPIKARLVGEIQAACRESEARIVLHVGRDPPDLQQLSYLPVEAEESGR